MPTPPLTAPTPVHARPVARPRGSASLWLALAWAALILYASLYPFDGWRWPPGQSLAALLALPSSQYRDRFDVVANLLGYLPLGLLAAVALRRRGVAAVASAAVATLAVAALSWSCEVAQQFVPRRVPSYEDLWLNAAGGGLGALLGVALHAGGVVGRWHSMRERWFTTDGAFGLALLLLWPVGLLFPASVPLGLGQVGPGLREWLLAWLVDVPWADGAEALLAAPAAVALRPLAEVSITVLGLLVPVLMAYAVMAAAWRRALVAFGALALGACAMTLSTWLNFGPGHATAWLTPLAVRGLGAGLLAALLLVPLPRRLAPGVGLIAATALVVLIAQAPTDPYFAQSLQSWEQGRFVRFHGAAQWVGWLWPYAAMGWLLSRLGRDR